MYPDTTPIPGDTDNVLLGKICQELNNQGTGNFSPQPGDSDNNLLRKIANLLLGN